MSAHEMNLLARCEPQTAPLQFTKQEVCFFNRAVYLVLTESVSLSGLGGRPEGGSLKVCLCSLCLLNAPLLKSLVFLGIT